VHHAVVDALCADFSNGDYLVIAGSDRKATLMTRDGVKLNTVAESKDWIWRAVPRPKTNFVAVACNDGTISMHSIVFSTVHGLYQDRYAFRGALLPPALAKF
jgi:intraflagellar transport protein 122